MKSLQERMTAMTPYFRGIEMYNDALMVKMVYPNKWKAFPSEDGRIKITPSDADPTLTYYYASSKDTTYDEMFDLIEQTIKVNQDIILKLELLKSKVNELKELFQTTEYDDLTHLKFVIDKEEKKKPKRKYTRKKKEAANEAITVESTDIIEEKKEEEMRNDE